MNTKTCPACSEEVPTVATRCKHCFHDFTEEPVKKSNGAMGLLILMLALVVVGAGTFGWIYYYNVAENIVVDAESSSIVITRTSASGVSTERVEFSDIKEIEYVLGGEKATFEVVAITTNGDRHIIQQSSSPLKGHAEHIASVVDKPLSEVRNIRTFGD